MKSDRDRSIRLLWEPPAEATRGPKAALSQARVVEDLRVALAAARHRSQAASGDLAIADAERAERSPAGTVRLSPAMFRRLTPPERLETRRSELGRALAALGARNPRLVEPREHGYRPDSILVLVDLDDPSQFAYGELIAVASEILEEIVDIAASNAPRPSLLQRAGAEQVS